MFITNKIRSVYLKNVLILITGSALSQVLPILVSPLLSRQFSPDQFATWGLYISIVTVILSISSGCYEQAIMQPKEENDAMNLFSLSLILSFCVSFFAFLVIIIFHKSIAVLLKDEHIEFWLYLVPFSVFILSILTSITNWFNRKEKYKLISGSKVIKNWCASVFQIGFGFMKLKNTGLIIGQIMGDIVATFEVGYVFLKRYKLLFIQSFSISSMKSLAKEYKHFPFFTLPTVLLNNISYYLLTLLISALFSSAVTGAYFFAFRLLSAPMALIGISVSQTFYQKFTVIIRDKTGNGKAFIYKIWLVLFGISVIPLGILFFFGPEIFSFIFGAEWIIAGKIAAISSPMILFSFISSPTSSTYIVLKKQNISVIFGLFVFIFRPLAFFVGYYLHDFFLGLKIYVIFEIVQIIFYNLIILLKIK